MPFDKVMNQEMVLVVESEVFLKMDQKGVHVTNQQVVLVEDQEEVQMIHVGFDWVVWMLILEVYLMEVQVEEHRAFQEVVPKVLSYPIALRVIQIHVEEQ